jgi:hypothetical protein
MIGLNHSRNLAARWRKGCFHVPLLFPAPLAAFERQSLLLVGWLLLATPVAVQAQFNFMVANGAVTITGYTGPGGTVTIPDTIAGLPVTAIGNSALAANTNLTSVTIPSGVISIGGDAFGDCTSLTAISVEANNPGYSSVGGVLFDKSQTILIQYPAGRGGSYLIPSSVTSIEGGAFDACISLASVTIPNSVTNIGDSAFLDCTSLTNVTIPSSITSIGFAAFSACSSLTAITVDSANQTYSSAKGVLFDKGQTWLIQYPPARVGASYAIPDTVTNIGDGAFWGSLSLANVTIIPNRNLTSVTIPNSVTSIGSAAFGGCTGLTNVTIPNSVTRIGDGAFGGCTGLTNVTMGNGVTKIGDWVFSGCTGLTSVYFQGNAPSGDSSVFPGHMDATAYYLPGATGWGPTFGGIPTAFWTLPRPLILNNSLSNQFGFTVSWATNLSVVVEATTDLGNPVWSPLTTNALSGGTFYFTDPQWTEYPSRFYRVRSQ